MKKMLRITAIILIVYILIIALFQIMLKLKSMRQKMEAIVVGVRKEYLIVINKYNTNELDRINITKKENIDYKEGQEILIYFDEIVSGCVYNVGKIKIIKEKSDIQIPDDVLRYCYSIPEKVDIRVAELTPNGIYLKISDLNERIKFNYSHKYTLRGSVKNEKYTGEPGTYVEAPGAATPAYIPPEEPNKYIWENLGMISNIASEDTEVEVSGAPNIIHRKFDWTELYGELKERKL